jgi:endonuclease/exonuclease/phosphatase (EEP) superfamily protein YafD
VCFVYGNILVDIAKRVYIIYDLLSHFVWFVVPFYLVCGPIFWLLSSFRFVVTMLHKSFTFLYGLWLLVVSSMPTGHTCPRTKASPTKSAVSINLRFEASSLRGHLEWSGRVNQDEKLIMIPEKKKKETAATVRCKT